MYQVSDEEILRRAAAGECDVSDEWLDALVPEHGEALEARGRALGLLPD